MYNNAIDADWMNFYTYVCLPTLFTFKLINNVGRANASDAIGQLDVLLLLLNTQLDK